jgi:RNA polymerase sigma-70 factor (ECF subfamily)
VSLHDESRRGQVFPLRRVSGAVTEMTDGALIAACAVGDGAAMGALFDRHSRAVYRFASRLAGVSSVDLDDMVSATFLEACRSARTFRGGSSVRTWLFGIAVNVARHHVRADVRRQAFLRDYQQAPVAGNVGPRPDDAAEQHQLLVKLERCLRALPHELRVAFLMCDVEEIGCADAARALGLRQGTVWKRLHRARKLLGSALR